MPTVPTNATALFSCRKRRASVTSLSSDPTTKRVHEWEKIQYGLRAALLKISRNSRVRKKRALDKLKMTPEYQAMSDELRSDAERDIIQMEEGRRRTEEQQAQDGWRKLNSTEEVGSDRFGGAELEVSDPEFEVHESIASGEAFEHEFDDEGNPKLSSNDIVEFTEIIQRAKQSFEGFIDRIQQQATEDEAIWDPDSSSDSENSIDESEEWMGIPDE